MKEFNCCECGVRIYIDDGYYASIKNNHRSFFCLNGHSQIFVGKTDKEQYEEINRIIKEESNKRIEELKKEVQKLREKSIHCDVCGKFFKSNFNLNRHKLKGHLKV